MSRDPVSDRVRLFGIRHHGPGSARSLLAALDEWQPQALLVEGPPESEPVIPYLLDAGLRTPVAMLLYATETPRWAAYYPLAEFSPELQAFRWASRHGVPLSMMDLPASAMLGLAVSGRRGSDSMDLLAEAAGFDDVEDWWEHLVEQREDPRDLFEGLEALMSALREAGPLGEEAEDSEEDPAGRRTISAKDYEAAREAHMRKTLREVLAQGHERVAVVCGAWHVPALRTLPPASKDDALLKGLPKVKVGSTVVPWTFDRLTFMSGYGAGVRSPAFYDLVWNAPPDEVPSRWLLSVARLMRDEDLDASPASVIEAVRLAEALTSLRGRPRPGLREMCEAAGSVLIRDDAVWRLIAERLIVGNRLGEVPETVPLIPLQADLTAQQKRLRMKVDDTDRKLELDLRNETDLERSHLLHRLRILEIDWGDTERVFGKKGTFHEHWKIQWRPELAIQLIEASIYGNTVESAASNKAAEVAAEAASLAAISILVEQVLLADLAEAVDAGVTKLQSLSATSTDVADLADALPPLFAAVRYGSVRRTATEQIAPILEAMFTRLCVGLPGACSSLDDAAAAAMARRLDDVTGVVRLFTEEERKEEWLGTLEAVATLAGCHALVMGKAERLRFDLGAVDGEYLALRLGQEGSRGATAQETAAFVEGLLSGPGAILLHQEPLFRAVDEWIVSLREDIFDEILPLIRRTFALYARAERRQIGERVASGAPVLVAAGDIDEERARRVLPIIRQILGLPNE